MSTYNDAAHLAESIESVLSQDFPDFEFIIVNDGSPDPRTAGILAGYAQRDPRIRVITKPNEGLTRALVDGCAAARGEYIARIDADDRYLPGRLGRQVAYLMDHQDIVLLSCGTRFVTDEGDFLYDCHGDPDPVVATATLRADEVQRVRGPNGHGSAMFRRAVYERAGGYRWQFYFAQDVDLWMRLTDHGSLAFLPEVLYEVTFAPSGISGRYAREQQRLTEMIVGMRQRRNRGQGEDDLLEAAAGIRPAAMPESPWARRRRLAEGIYFVGCILARNGNPRAGRHLRRAVIMYPLSVRHWMRLLLSCVRAG
jgi:glycosyltransferase involved in cell wall biosynthesis